MSHDTQPEVVVSGLGVVTYAGEGLRRLELVETGEVDEVEQQPVEPPTQVELEPGLTVGVGRIGRIKRHPFRDRFEKMSQLDAFSQYAVIATGHALDDAGMSVPDEALEEVGVILGSCFGCQEANFRFDQFDLSTEGKPEGVRPAVFKNTVDNVPAGWISVGYGLRGVNSTFTTGPSAGAEAIQAAFWAVRSGRTNQVVTGGVDRLIDLQLAALHRRDRWSLPFPAEGAAVVVLESVDTSSVRGHRPRARLVDTTRIASGDPRAVQTWLDGSHRSPSTIALSSVVAPTCAGREALGKELLEAGLRSPHLVESDGTGDMFAAQGPMAFALLIKRLEALEVDRPHLGLLAVAGEADEALLFLIEG